MTSTAPSVLGIDAAWTMTQPSGVALVTLTPEGWSLRSAASSYGLFQALEGSWAAGTVTSQAPDVSTLLSACRGLIGAEPDIVAVDMPLARTPITSRRASDDAVSRAYGSRHCSTHTPSGTRPGPISDKLTLDFHLAGYTLATKSLTDYSLIEVYPHPALVELTGATRRLPYKASKLRAYWPELAPPQRRERLVETWRDIVQHVEQVISGVVDQLELPRPDATGRALKGFEDKLDAVVCAWVGVCALEGKAVSFGDETSAIWIPVATTPDRAVAKRPFASEPGQATNSQP